MSCHIKNKLNAFHVTREKTKIVDGQVIALIRQKTTSEKIHLWIDVARENVAARGDF